MTERVKRAFVAKAMMIALGVLLAPIPAARAQLLLPAKCTVAGNISLDDRIAGCTALIDAMSTNLQEAISAHFRRAALYLDKGDVDRAIEDYNFVIERDPNNQISLLRRAWAYKRKGEVDRALADYGRAIELAPKDTYAYLGRAGAHLIKKDVDSAIDDYGRALLTHPDNVAAYVGRGRAYNLKDEPDRAIADCNRAIEISPERGAGVGLICRGHAHIIKGDIELALDDFNQAIRFNPKNPLPYVGRASILRARGDLELGLSNIKQAIELTPNDPQLHRWAGSAYFQGGLLSEAHDEFVRASELDRKDVYTLLWLDLVRQKTGQPSGLDEASGRLDQSQWPAPIVRLFLGATTLEAVIKAADDANPVKVRGQLCEAHFYGGELALAKGATDEAVRLLRLAADGCPRIYFEWAPANAELHKLDTRH
ncbi:tetratricopeptide (TPR) repeat protein [Bradyrhizobium sp. USDA 4341]